jgi:glutamate-1-semialdehyde 2,1-aminomutase
LTAEPSYISQSTPLTSVLIDRVRLTDLFQRERMVFAERNPRSWELFESTRRTLLGGVPMCWMALWAGGFPIFFEEAHGNRIRDVDGHTYIDFCLGDTGAMAGHAPEATAAAVERQYRRGATAMLPTEDASWVGGELVRRFGLEAWQFCLTASDANRYVLRIARHLTGRSKVLVFNGCYHGTVDEAVIELDRNGVPRPRHGNIGPMVDPRMTTCVIEFNDVGALEQALGQRDIACVLAEPALTNIGIVLPEPGYHEAMRELTERSETLLVIDETHTMSSGPGGYTAAHGLRPDALTVGKSIAGGIPIGAYGLRRGIADQLLGTGVELDDSGAFGSTLGGNALSMAAARATLQHVLTNETYKHTISLAKRFASSIRQVIASRQLPWHIVQLGARSEYRFSPLPPRNGGESARIADPDLDAYLHCYLLNRGILITPFHNMALMAPTTTAEDVDRHVEVFADAADELLGTGSQP